MVDEPLYTVETEQFTATFMLDEGNELESLEFNDALIVLPDGSRWSATFATLDGLARIMDEGRKNGVFLNGSYVQFSDLVVVRDPGVQSMLNVIQGILDDEDEYFEDTFQRLEPDDDDQDDLG